MIKVVLVDDQAVVRTGFTVLLEPVGSVGFRSGRPGVFGDFTGRALAHRLAVHIGLSRPFDPHMDTRGWRSDSLWAIVGP